MRLALDDHKNKNNKLNKHNLKKIAKMSSHEEWHSEKLSKLLQEELRISTLTELKDHLQSVSRDEALKIVNGLNLPLVFDCLNDTNSEQVDLACEVLSLCLENLNLGESTSKYAMSIEKALIHPYTPVKMMALREIERNVSNEQVLDDICKKTALFNNIILCIGDQDLGVAKKATNIIEMMGTTIPGINKLTSSDIIKTVQEVMGSSEIVRLRVYETLVNISVISEFSFNKLRSTGLITQLLQEVNTDDVLLKMNIIEILTPLGLSDHGFKFLDENKILKEFLNLIVKDVEEDYTLQLCKPGVIKFFGNLTNKRPNEILSKYGEFFDCLLSIIEDSDLTMVGIVFDTVAHIAQTNQGKMVLKSTGPKISKAIKSISSRLSQLPTELRIRALSCLESLLRINENQNEVIQLTNKWFELLGDNPMDVVLHYAKNPFGELRMAGLGILGAIAGQEWGQEAIRNTPGLVEFLLDRSSETLKECKDKKYEIVESLANSTIFDRHTAERLKSFVKEGPHYVRAITEVAVEGNE